LQNKREARNLRKVRRQQKKRRKKMLLKKKQMFNFVMMMMMKIASLRKRNLEMMMKNQS
jgi:hypothetical protein